MNFARFDSLVYILSLAHGKNLARSRSSRFSLATARSRSRLQVYLLDNNEACAQHSKVETVETQSTVVNILWRRRRHGSRNMAGLLTGEISRVHKRVLFIVITIMVIFILSQSR